MKLRLGTRGSRLALAQAAEAARALSACGYETEQVVVHTRGDDDRASPLSALGRGAFTDVLARMLERGEIDVAVHSAKDLPTDVAHDGFFCLPRADARDVLLTVKGRAVCTVGTGSPRRAAAIAALLPQASVTPIRGNVDTRIRKLLDGEVDALILAAAGLERLAVCDARLQMRVLSPAECVPAACQGIIALEGAPGEAVHDAAAGRAARIERACQRALGGGCTGGAGSYFDGIWLYAQSEGKIARIRYTGEGDIAALARGLI